MKRISLSALVYLLFSAKVFAQTDLHCATDEMMKKLYESHPALKAKLDKHEALSKNITGNKTASASYTIPIVFHILHLGGPENISDNQVMDALNILNRDYAKQNPDTSAIIPSFKQIADSTGIQFALATLDPLGNCTNGIIHHYDTDADWNDGSSTIYSYSWDPTMYLNVYVVRTITLGSGFGAAGYTYFPGSFAPGDPYDAIVVLNNYFGSIGTGSVLQSRVLTHEVGHWLNLLHVFGFNGAGIDCTGDDFINDTPPTPGYLLCPDAGNPSSYQLCTPGVDENYQNYMDYSYCCKMFTQEQGARMRTALNDNIAGRDNLWTTSNLLATGVVGMAPPCVPIADFNYDRSETCVNVPVTFTDASWNGQPTSYSWQFPSGNPATSTSASPAVTYSVPGIYSATLTTSNSSGTSAPVTKTNIITVVNNVAAYQNVWSEGFETSPLPNADWSIANSSGGANWEQTADASYTGTFSARLPAANNTRKTVTSMTGPVIDLSSIPNPVMTFKVAATELNPDHINTLQLFASTDCEQTWSQSYSKTGNALVTTIDSLVPFIPIMQSQWRTETISLSPFSSAATATFRFAYTRDTLPGPSNVYIDDINISSTTGINGVNAENGFEVFPNPSEGTTSLSLTLSGKTHIKINVTDVAGRVVEETGSYVRDAGLFAIAVGEKNKLRAGIYMVHVTLDEKTFVKKIVTR